MLVDNFKLAGASEGTARDVANAVVNEIIQDRKRKNIDLEKNWEMYQGHHTQYFKQRINEDNAIFEYRKKNAVTVNYVDFTIDLSARYLYGRASKILRKYSENAQTQKRMTELARKVELDTFCLNASKKAATFGKQTARLVPVDALTGLQPVGRTTKTCYPHPFLLDPLNTYVKRNNWGKIIAVVVKYKANQWAKHKVTNVTELIVDDSRWMWVDEGDLGLALDALSVGVPDTFGQGKFVRQENKYKLSDEFVDLLNNPDERSDIENILDLNITLDEAYTDNKHFFSKHGWPQLVSEVNLENVQNSPNKVWEITPDVDDGKKVLDRLGFLTWDGKMADHRAYIENLERLILIQSNTAAISTGDLKAIGQLRSGAALITAHSVAIHKTEEKQIVWERNEKNLLRAMANFDSYIHAEKVESRYRDLDPIITFPRDFVPGAEHERAQIQQIMVNSHLIPLREVIKQNVPEAVDPEVCEKLYKEIMADSRDISDSTRTFESIADEGPTGKSGTSMQKSKEQK
jgi:hypothetical protein